MTALLRSPRHRRAEAIAAAAAVALHGAALAAIALPREAPAPPPEARVVELSVTVEEPPPPDEVPAPATTPDENTPPHELPRQAPREPHVSAVASARAPEGPPVATVETAPANSSGAPWTPSWSIPQGIDLGLDGGVAWRTALRAETGGPGPRTGSGPSDPGELRALLDAHDREIGLGSGGPVVRAVHDVEQTVSAVRDGAATIEVTTDAAGHVLTVHAFDATSDGARWNETAQAIAAALEGHTLAVPRGASGMVITVRVEVAVRSVSGAAAGRPVSSMMNTDGVGVGFDVTDLGSRARSVVHARIVGERRL